jgi:Mono-functional DNA-alkylating methyl methanesulfonate N-term
VGAGRCGHWARAWLSGVAALPQVLAIGETVEEVNDSGFLGSTPTLRTQLMADDSMLQVRSTSAACRAPCTTKRCTGHCLLMRTSERLLYNAQVHGAGLRHIKADRRVNEWRAPGRRTIMKAATNERQASRCSPFAPDDPRSAPLFPASTSLDRLTGGQTPCQLPRGC